jgi:protocatechuate 3,4-dioxygenase beta subunit
VHDGHDHAHDRGLAFDLSTLMTRRRALGLAAVGGLMAVVGCASSSSSGDASTAATSASADGTATGGSSSATQEIPEETAGPFPADGSNGPDVLTESGIVRSDITSSFGAGSGVAAGVPLAIDLAILDVSAGGTPVEGAAVYLWHCDREGRYSIYDASIANENYLRGVQVSDSGGRLSFASIFPAAYSGRWPHIHFEVYPSLDAATGGGSKLVTSQIALPEDACRLVYATDGYAQSAANLAQTSLATDMVFADGYSTQLGTVSGSPAAGMRVALNVGV